MNGHENEGAAGAMADPPPRNEARAVSGVLVFVMVAAALLLVGGLIFRDFLFGEKLLLYKDVGADSVMDTYPTFLHLSDYIRHHGIPSWSFSVGMGQNLFYLTGDLILEPIVWLRRELIPYALVFQHLCKALIAGLLFFRFLRLRGVNRCGSLAGSLCLAFSAHMSMGSCWIISADDTLCFTFVLFAVEEAIVSRRWLYLPIAVALSGLVTVFQLYLSAVLLCFYVPARLIEIYGWKPIALSRVSARLALLALLGLGLGAVLFLGSFYSVLNSPRASGTIANFAFGPAPAPFQLGSKLYYITAALRPFANDMIGAGDAYRGWENYYEGPLSYCGLLSLLIFPQAFSGATRRQRILYAAFLALIMLAVVFPWFRYLFWLFRGGYFRAFSLFSIFGVLGLSMMALFRYTEGGTLNLWMLGATLAVLLGILYCPIHEMQALVNHELAWTATILLIIYAALLLIGQMAKRQRAAGWIILALTAFELVHFNRITVNRPTITKQELKERVGYNDETVDALRDIKASDDSFFRVTKSWGSVDATRAGFNDAMAFGYYATTSYSAFNNLNYIKFLMAVDAIDRANAPSEAQASPGLLCCPLLLTFACEKYVLTPDPVSFQVSDEYELVRRYGDIYVFRNNFSSPFGVVFTNYISEGTFSQVPGEAKAQAILNTAVLADEDALSRSEMTELTFDRLNRQMHERSTMDLLSQLRQTAFRIQSFDQTHITGNVHLDQNGVVVFQMPFDAGWHFIVDNRNVPPIKVDIGLVGVVLHAGEHNLDMFYRSPFLFPGAVLSIVSCVILVFSAWRWPRLRMPE